MTDFKVVIGVPVPMDYMADVRTIAYCSAEATRLGVTWGYVASRDAGVGRSTFAHIALQDPDVTHLYFMDYDVLPPNGALATLLQHDVPIVAGVYRMTTSPPAWSFKMDDKWYGQGSPLPKGPTKVTCVAGSTLLVKREVFEKVPNPPFKIEYRAIDEDGRCYDEGEDEYFSRVAQEAGYDLMIDPSVVCEHFKKGAI